MSFKTAIIELAPRWLAAGNAGALLRTFGTMFDNLNAQLKLGMKARLPEHAPDDALGFIGNDRSIEKGPSESLSNYRTRLVGGVDANRTRGSARQLLKQLAGYLHGTGEPPLRLVSNSAVWHEYNWGTGEPTKTIVGDNWNWDGLTTRWWRGWAIIDSSAGPWAPGAELGEAEGGTFDDDLVLGCDATEQEVQAVQRIVQKWKPANVYVPRVIVTFDSGLFERTDASPTNPDGDYGDPANWSADAAYWLSGGEEP